MPYLHYISGALAAAAFVGYFALGYAAFNRLNTEFPAPGQVMGVLGLWTGPQFYTGNGWRLKKLQLLVGLAALLLFGVFLAT